MIYHRRYFLLPLAVLGGIVLLSALLLSAPARAARPNNPPAAPRQGIPTASPTPGCPLAWGLVPAPILGNSSTLNALVALDPTNIWAVGSVNYANGGGTLIEHWNGSSWSIVPSPAAPGWYSDLKGISALAADDIWAVGYSEAGNQRRGLLAPWQ